MLPAHSTGRRPNCGLMTSDYRRKWRFTPHGEKTSSLRSAMAVQNGHGRKKADDIPGSARGVIQGYQNMAPARNR
jgi:hypothetical protein